MNASMGIQRNDAKIKADYATLEDRECWTEIHGPSEEIKPEVLWRAEMQQLVAAPREISLEGSVLGELRREKPKVDKRLSTPKPSGVKSVNSGLVRGPEGWNFRSGYKSGLGWADLRSTKGCIHH